MPLIAEPSDGVAPRHYATIETSGTFAERMARAGSSLARAGEKLTRMRFPFKAPSLIHKTRPYFSGVRRFGVSSVRIMLSDPFHSMLNLSWGRFILVFFVSYLIQYILFAFIYWMQATGCMVGSNGQFSHALWVSSRVASTLGFDQIHPNPDCQFINFTVMMQVISSSLVNYMMLGVVFARFSAPFKRASTVRFSTVAVVNRHPSGFWSITMRVANLRKHQILQPCIRMVVTAVDTITPSYYHHEQLTIDSHFKQLTNLELGFPSQVTHVVTPDSFLYDLSLTEMDTRMMEILVFVDGIDAMTSKHMSARIAYATGDMLMNEQFAPMNLEMRGKHMGLDFTEFDKTLPALDPGLLLDLQEAGATSGEGGGLWQLRAHTFRRLAERYAHLGAAHTAAVAAAAVGNGGAHMQGGSEGGGWASPSASPTASKQPGNVSLDMGGIQEEGPETHGLLHAPHTGAASHRGLAAATRGMGMPFAVSRASAQTTVDHAGIVGVVDGLMQALGGGKSSSSGGAEGTKGISHGGAGGMNTEVLQGTHSGPSSWGQPGQGQLPVSTHAHNASLGAGSFSQTPLATSNPFTQPAGPTSNPFTLADNGSGELPGYQQHWQPGGVYGMPSYGSPPRVQGHIAPLLPTSAMPLDPEPPLRQ